ncbi:MAG: ElyC/SanA/YdcF family protein, partial [Aggregatilineales bacterium]
ESGDTKEAWWPRLHSFSVGLDGSPDLALTRRSQHGANLWLAGRAPYILCSGGFPENRPRSEAAACAEVLMNAGVPEDAIFLEERSRSTEENALDTEEMLQRENLQSVLLVTDTYHMFRATYLFNRQGMTIFANPVLEMPNTSFYIRSVFREAAALHWQIFKDALGLPYTYVPLV